MTNEPTTSSRNLHNIVTSTGIFLSRMYLKGATIGIGYTGLVEDILYERRPGVDTAVFVRA